MSSFNLVVDQWDLSEPGDSQQFSKYGYITYQALFCQHAKYSHTKLGQTVVMNIWNVDDRQANVPYPGGILLFRVSFK